MLLQKSQRMCMDCTIKISIQLEEAKAFFINLSTILLHIYKHLLTRRKPFNILMSQLNHTLSHETWETPSLNIKIVPSVCFTESFFFFKFFILLINILWCELVGWCTWWYMGCCYLLESVMSSALLMVVDIFGVLDDCNGM